MNAAIALTGLDLVIQLIDRVSAAAALVKQAHAEGRELTSAELDTLRVKFDQHLSALDTEIARAVSEGR